MNKLILPWGTTEKKKVRPDYRTTGNFTTETTFPDAMVIEIERDKETYTWADLLQKNDILCDVTIHELKAMTEESDRIRKFRLLRDRIVKCTDQKSSAEAKFFNEYCTACETWIRSLTSKDRLTVVVNGHPHKDDQLPEVIDDLDAWVERNTCCRFNPTDVEGIFNAMRTPDVYVYHLRPKLCIVREHPIIKWHWVSKTHSVRMDRYELSRFCEQQTELRQNGWANSVWQTPALVPQVWVNKVDSYILKEFTVPQQRIDFMLRWDVIGSQIAVIEIDGIYHFSKTATGGNPIPDMDAYTHHLWRDRHMRSQNWSVYRFSSREVDETGADTLLRWELERYLTAAENACRSLPEMKVASTSYDSFSPDDDLPF